MIVFLSLIQSIIADDNETLTKAGQDNSTSDNHIGWIVNLIVLGIVFICSGIVIVLTWRFRDKIRIHNRQPKQLWNFKMTDKKFIFSLTKRFSLTTKPMGRKKSAVPRNMGLMQAYTNGMKRDSWDVSRDSITGGPRASWVVELNNYKVTHNRPRLSTISGSVYSLAQEDGEASGVQGDQITQITDV